MSEIRSEIRVDGISFMDAMKELAKGFHSQAQWLREHIELLGHAAEAEAATLVKSAARIEENIKLFEDAAKRMSTE